MRPKPADSHCMRPNVLALSIAGEIPFGYECAP
jgi:hypothetical protein